MEWFAREQLETAAAAAVAAWRGREVEKQEAKDRASQESCN